MYRMRPISPKLFFLLLTVPIALAGAAPARAMRPPELPAAEAAALKRDFQASLSKLKGPYSENFCVCKNGDKRPVRDAAGRITSPCGHDEVFCAAFRAPLAESLSQHRVWIANIFSRDLWLWPQISDHRDLVCGYILEKYFVETNPANKLAELKAFGGLSGAEYETGAAPQFFEKFLAEPGFDDSRDFPLAYELQRRYFLRDDLGQVQKVRAMSVRVQDMDAKFKPLRDAIHNQLSAGLVPQVAAYRDKLPQGAERTQIEQVIVELSRLTRLDEQTLKEQLAALSDAKLKADFTAKLPAPDGDPVAAMAALGAFMRDARRAVAAKSVTIPDARRLIDLDITAAAVMQARGNALLADQAKLTARQSLQLLSALTDAAYGCGLLVHREHEAAQKVLAKMLADASPTREEFARNLRLAGRIVEWAQVNATLPYAQVWAQWTLLMPQIAGIGDDVLRSSPLLLYAKVYGRLDTFASGAGVRHHDLFGTDVTNDVRVLNPGLAVGKLRFTPKDDAYQRNEIVALNETPADLEPAAGILTEGEGNVLSHVQLLARSLGIPNVVLGPDAFALMKPHDGETTFMVATPGGRVIIKPKAQMTEVENAAWSDYTGNDTRKSEISGFGAGLAKLHIDTAKVDLTKRLPIDLNDIRRSDSGRICGPKAAFLGELKHLFPDKVARGIVVPFGAYRDHYLRIPVAVPDSLKNAGIATPGGHLSEYVETTFHQFFDQMLPAAKDPKSLSTWISPRLDVIRYSIEAAPLSPELRAAIRDGLDKDGLLKGPNKTDTVGCFVRSDTNVEDLDSFNGAGLNLTVFNMGSLEDIYTALKQVWASPFELRSFSWRQSLIDEPLWVLPSVVILESVPNDKSGVLVTCDVETGDRSKMIVATSEGPGGAVDGTSAETLRWSPDGVDLLTLYKSPWKNALIPGGGSRIVPSSGRDEVLAPKELDDIIAAGKAIDAQLTPARDSMGRPRAWDIEFGFHDGHLWLFQSRPFIGNESVKNVPALAVLDGPGGKAAGGKDELSLKTVLQ